MSTFLDESIEANRNGSPEVARHAVTSMAAFILSKQTILDHTYRERENNGLFECAMQRQHSYELAQKIDVSEVQSETALIRGASAIAQAVIKKEVGIDVLLDIPARFLTLDPAVTEAIKDFYKPLETVDEG